MHLLLSRQSSVGARTRDRHRSAGRLLQLPGRLPNLSTAFPDWESLRLNGQLQHSSTIWNDVLCSQTMHAVSVGRCSSIFMSERTVYAPRPRYTTIIVHRILQATAIADVRMVLLHELLSSFLIHCGACKSVDRGPSPFK